MSISLNWRSGVRVSTASMPGSFGESRSGIASPLRIGLPSRGRVVSVERDLDRACAAVVRHSEPSDLRYLALREADCRQDRLLLRPDDRDRGIGGRLLARELEDADDVRVIGPFDRRCVDGVPEIAAVIRAGSVWFRASFSVCANSARRLS